MARVAGFQGVFQPTARFGSQAGSDEIEIPGVLSSEGFGFEQQDNLGNEDRDASGGPHSDAVEPSCDGGIPSELPACAGRLVKQELDAGAGLRSRVDLVNREIEPFPVGPRKSLAIHDLLERPGREMRPEFGLVVSKDRDVDVVVLPCLAPQEDIDRPSSGDVPGARKPSHQSGNFEDGAERRHGPVYSFVHRRILRRHARRPSGIPLQISRVTGPSYPRAFSALISRSRSIVPFPKGKCSSPISPWPPWLSCTCARPRRSPSAARYVLAPSVRASRWACPTSRQYRRSGTASRTFRSTSGGSSTFSTATMTPRSVAALTRSANHEVFASGEVRGAERASMKWALKICVPIGASASMNPTNFARSAWWKWDGGRWAVSRGIFSARPSAGSCNAGGPSATHVRSSSA